MSKLIVKQGRSGRLIKWEMSKMALSWADKFGTIYFVDATYDQLVHMVECPSREASVKHMKLA